MDPVRRLMIKVTCPHVSCYKITNGLIPYTVLHRNFVTCFRKTAREKKATKGYCRDCHTKQGRLHACLSCVFYGCFNYGHMQKHSQEVDGHIISMDIKFGHIYCHECEDYAYDKDFERISRALRIQNAMRRGKKVHTPWEPTPEEVLAIMEHGGLKKINDKSLIGMRGLVNLGHTCFMNCIIQVLVHTPLLLDYFLSDSHQCEMEDPNSCLVCEMFVTYQEFYRGKLSPLVPSRLVYLMWTYAKHLNGFQQHDAHEFFIAILDIMHRQCQANDPDPIHRCNCVIDQIFKGFYQSDIVCQKCNHVSTTFEPFLDISLHLGGSANEGAPLAVSLQDCIARYTVPENLHSQCPICCTTSRTKQLTLYGLPVVTCFHIKRLEDSLGAKNTTHVVFPEVLDMGPYMSSNRNKQLNVPTRNKDPQDKENKFYLFAVVYHKGDRDGGHYVSYIRQKHNKWYACDDEAILPIARQHVMGSEGYLLFYHKYVTKRGIHFAWK